MNNVLTWLRNRIFRVRQFTARYPWMFFTLYQLSPINRKLMVTRKTKVTIEGYPRSANTYAVYAFRHSNPDLAWDEIGHHLHVQAQIIRSRDYGVPVILLIRHPLEAVRSLVVRHRFIPVNEALADYTRFYTDLLQLRDSFVIVDFEKAISDMGGVIDLVNSKFGRQFNVFPDQDETAKAAVFAEIDKRNEKMDKGRVSHLYRPDEGKDLLKGAVEIDEGGELYRKAVEIYQTFVQSA